MLRRAYVWTHDIAGEQSGVIGRDFIDIYTDTTLDQDERLVFEIPADHPKAYLLAEDINLRLAGRTYYVDEIEQERKASELTIRVQASALWQRLADQDHIGSLSLDDMSVRDGAVEVLTYSLWTVGPRTANTGAFSMEVQDRSILANVRTWAKITGTYVEFDTQAMTVDWLASRGNDIGLAFRKGRNLRNLRRRRTPPKVTRLFPFGRDDLSIAGVNGGDYHVEDLTFYTNQGVDETTARELYAKRRVIRDQSFIKDTDLLAWAEEYIAREAQSIEHVDLDVIDISEITGVDEDMQVGDNCRAFDPDFNEEFSAVITGIRRYPLQPWRNQVELSTSPSLVDDPDASTGEYNQSDEWIMFTGPVSADFAIRNDSLWTVARIPLRFRGGGKAHFHLDLWMEGVDAGTATVTVVDATDGNAIQKETLTVAYTNGARSRVLMSWAAEDLSGSKDYRVRVTTTATGGASPSKGVNLTIEDQGLASFYIVAQGAVQESPVSPNSQTFTYTGAVQMFTVPDNVTEVTIIAAGGEGGEGVADAATGLGAVVTGTFAVVPGTEYDVYVGGEPDPIPAQAGWPDGGAGGQETFTAQDAGGGGGSSSVRPVGGSITSAIIVAPGGGGTSSDSAGTGDGAGGHGGLFFGNDGTGAEAQGGFGATQVAGGAGGVDGSNGTAEAGDSDGQGQGGDGMTNNSGSAGGGGGGGLHGGGGGAFKSAVDGGGGGGGGSGYISPAAYNVHAQDGANSGHGTVTFQWDTPAI